MPWSDLCSHLCWHPPGPSIFPWEPWELVLPLWPAKEGNHLYCNQYIQQRYVVLTIEPKSIAWTSIKVCSMITEPNVRSKEARDHCVVEKPRKLTEVSLIATHIHDAPKSPIFTALPWGLCFNMHIWRDINIQSETLAGKNFRTSDL